jgi:hypothetical protein
LFAAHFPQFFKNPPSVWRINPQKNRKKPVTPEGILGLNYIEKTAHLRFFVAADEQQIEYTRRE